MAVPTFTIYNGTSAAVTHTIPLPAGRAGARVFLFLGLGLSATFNPNGSTWTQLAAMGILGGVYYRDCTGSESNPSVTLTASGQYRAATAMLAAGSFAPGSAPVFSNAGQSTLDPGAVSTNSGDGTVLAFASWSANVACNLTSNPSTYTAGVSGNASASIVGVSVCYRNLAPAASSENPGVFTVSAAIVNTSSYTIFQAATLTTTLHTNTQQFGGDDGVTNFTPPALDASAFTFGQSPSANTSHTVPLPADLNGKRIIIAFTGLGTAVSSIVFPAGWTEIDTTSNANERQEIFYRDCDGSEGASITVTTATSILASWGVVEFPKGSYDRAQAPVGAATTSTSTLTPNPGSVNSGASNGFSRGAWWLSSFGQRGVASPPTLTAAPAGFTLRGSSLGVNVYGTAWADKVDNVQTLDPGTWTTTGTATNQSASTIAVKAAWPVATLVFTTPATILQPPLFTNAQAFYAPTIYRLQRITAPHHQNAQAFYAPTLRMRYSVALHTNAQTFYGPTITRLQRLSLAARYDNSQTFYAPTLRFNLRLTAPFHQNAQTFFGPKLQATIKAPLHTNAQTFYAPRLRATYKVAARHDNAQAFYGPTIVVTLGTFLAPPRHDNAQTFYAPRLRATYKLVRYDNAPTFYGPSLRLNLRLTAPFHINAQAFYAPTLKFNLRLLQAARHDNAQQFFGPTITRLQKLVAPFHVNAQAFYGPTIAVAAAGLVLPPGYVNHQAFYGPTLIFGLPPQPPDGGDEGRGRSGWDPYRYVSRKRARNRRKQVEDFLEDVLGVPYSGAPREVQQQITTAKQAALAYTAIDDTALAAEKAGALERALREISAFYAAARAEAQRLAQEREDDEDEDILLLGAF